MKTFFLSSILLITSIIGCKTSDDTEDLSGLWRENIDGQIPGSYPDYLWLDDTGSGSVFLIDTLCYVTRSSSWENDIVLIDDVRWKVLNINDSSLTLTFDDTLPDSVIGYYIDMNFRKAVFDTNSLARCIE